MNTVVLILVLLFTLIIGASLFCGCCKYPILGFFGISSPIKEGADGTTSADAGAPGTAQSVKIATEDILKAKKSTDSIPAIVTAHALDGFSSKNTAAPREGFINDGASTLGADLDDKNNGDLASSWITKATTFSSEFGYGDMNNTGTAYTGTPTPLPDGELVIFAQNKFKPECCPSQYSSSTGCACITPEQIKYLNSRGGNVTCNSSCNTLLI
jgi:hypothetical protein